MLIEADLDPRVLYGRDVAPVISPRPSTIATHFNAYDLRQPLPHQVSCFQ